MTMLEKMARAMAGPDFDRLGPFMQNGFRDQARIALAAMEELFATAAECADDLAAHLNHEHQYRDRYQTIQHDYDRDMDVVVRLRAMMEKLT